MFYHPVLGVYSGGLIEGARKATKKEVQNHNKEIEIKEAAEWFRKEQEKRQFALVTAIGELNEIGQEKIRESLEDLKIEYKEKIKVILEKYSS